MSISSNQKLNDSQKQVILDSLDRAQEFEISDEEYDTIKYNMDNLRSSIVPKQIKKEVHNVFSAHMQKRL